MPIEGVDAQIQNLISDAQLQYQREASQSDEGAAARREIEKKAEQKKAAIKQNVAQRETDKRESRVDARMQQILGGAAGPDAQQALSGWQANKELQSKLTEAQRNMFREAMATNPKSATESANAMNRLATTPEFKQAVQTSPQAATVHQALIENPRSEKVLGDALNTRFMKSSKADQQTKNDFLRFAMQRNGDGKMDALKKASDMLGSLVGKGVSGSGQRAAMSMATRRPDDTKAMGNVDAFVQNPQVSKLPGFARGKSTELLAKANGTSEVKEGFETLAGNGNFKAQTAQNKGRFFSTIGSGKPSEFRALTDKMLVALQSQGFPTREGQVSKLLGRVAAQVQKGGADSVDPESVVKQAKTSALPKAPTMVSTEGLSDTEANQARSQNRANIIQFYTQLSRVYEQAEKKLGSAKYFEDVNSLQTLRKPEEIDPSTLAPEDVALVQAKSEEMDEKLDGLQKLQRQKARELRTKRMPAAKRRAIQSERRASGRKPKYFNPTTMVGREKATQAFAKAANTGGAAESQQKLAQTPFRSQLAERSGQARTGSVDIQRHVATALQQVQRSGMTDAGQIAQSIAQTVARQVAETVGRQVAQQVTAQLLGQSAETSTETSASETTRTDISTQQQTGQTRAQKSTKQQGKVDGWGIPRTFERDLGGADRTTVKAPSANLEATSAESSQATQAVVSESEPYAGKELVRDGSSVRDLDTLMQQTWKSMSRPEVALLKNLGWSQQSWDTKDTPAAKWPMTMVTAYVNLAPVQRESLRKLGMTARQWDGRVQAFTMGKNA